MFGNINQFLHFSSFLVLTGHQIWLKLRCFLARHLDNKCHQSIHCLQRILFEDPPIHNNQAKMLTKFISLLHHYSGNVKAFRYKYPIYFSHTVYCLTLKDDYTDKIL